MDNATENKRNPMSVLFFTVFIDMLGIGILIPVIPLLFADPASGFYLMPPGTPLSTGLILLGLIVGIFPFMQFLATPILGQLSDRYGRRRLLAISLAGTALGYVLFAIGIMTKNIPLLFFSRALDGITGGNISIAQASIADITEPKDRAKNFGMIGAAVGLGFIVGPFLGGVLSSPQIVSWFDAATPFWFAAILATLNMMSVLYILPETLAHPRVQPMHWNQSIKNVWRAFTLKHLRVYFLAAFLFFAGFAFFTSFFNVFLIERFGFDQASIGNFFAYIGIWIAITQIVITRRLAKRFTDYSIMRFTLPLTGVTVMLYFIMTAWWQMLFIAPFMAVFIGLTMANSTSFVSRSVDAQSQGEILGVNASVAALANSIPPIISGFIAASVFPSAPILVGSIVIMLAGAIFIAFVKPMHGEHVPKE